MKYVEIRAGEGGVDAEQFAKNLTETFVKWGDKLGLRVERVDGVLTIVGPAQCL